MEAEINNERFLNEMATCSQKTRLSFAFLTCSWGHSDCTAARSTRRQFEFQCHGNGMWRSLCFL